jgi:abortive infection bacteriophage resistance protein
MIKKDLFKQNSKFKDVISLYDFDELRILLFELLKIEISLRTKINLSPLSRIYPWWFQDFDLFIDSRELVKH